MHWWFLSAAIFFEVIGTTAMKLSKGFTNLWFAVLMFSCYGVAFVFNTLALRKLDLSVTYATWCGVGTAIVAVIGMTYFREEISSLKIASIVLIIVGVVGLAASVKSS
jgi:small multidrug resistance pump